MGKFKASVSGNISKLYKHWFFQIRLYIKSNTGCITSASVTLSEYGSSSDDPSAAGTNTWIGHAYKGMNFNNYIGYFTEAETFNEGFGGNTTCFPVTSSSGPSSLYTEQFSVAFKLSRKSKNSSALFETTGNKTGFWFSYSVWKLGVEVNLNFPG